MKYKVGDRVRIVSKWNTAVTFDKRESLVGSMDKYLGTVMTINDIRVTSTGVYTYQMEEDNGRWWWFEHMIERKEDKEMFTLNDLKNGMLVELRNGDRCLVLCNNECRDASEQVLVSVNRKTAYSFRQYSIDCTHKCLASNDIMRVVCPYCYPCLADIDYEFNCIGNVIFDRSKLEERKRMTVEEIEQRLGYKIAIVDEEGK